MIPTGVSLFARMSSDRWVALLPLRSPRQCPRRRGRRLHRRQRRRSRRYRALRTEHSQACATRNDSHVVQCATAGTPAPRIESRSASFPRCRGGRPLSTRRSQTRGMPRGSAARNATKASSAITRRTALVSCRPPPLRRRPRDSTLQMPLREQPRSGSLRRATRSACDVFTELVSQKVAGHAPLLAGRGGS